MRPKRLFNVIFSGVFPRLLSETVGGADMSVVEDC